MCLLAGICCVLMEPSENVLVEPWREPSPSLLDFDALCTTCVPVGYSQSSLVFGPMVCKKFFMWRRKGRWLMQGASI